MVDNVDDGLPDLVEIFGLQIVGDRLLCLIATRVDLTGFYLISLRIRERYLIRR